MTSKEAKSLAAALKRKFGGRVEFENVDGNGRYGFAIWSKKFNGVPHMKRQDDIWEIINEVLDRESILDLGAVIAYAPNDVALSK